MLSGRDVVDSMIEHLSRDVMILVHSVNEYGSASMIKNLVIMHFTQGRLF